MRPLGKAVVRAGIVEGEAITEMRRWGLPVEPVDDVDVIEDPEMAVKVIQDALDSGEQVRMQDTDLDILNRWLDPSNQLTGKLVLHAGEHRSSSKVTFCWTLMKEVAFPWKADSIEELMLEGQSHLKAPHGEGYTKYFFTGVRELYIGDTKAFIVASVQEET